MDVYRLMTVWYLTTALHDLTVTLVRTIKVNAQNTWRDHEKLGENKYEPKTGLLAADSEHVGNELHVRGELGYSFQGFPRKLGKASRPHPKPLRSETTANTEALGRSAGKPAWTGGRTSRVPCLRGFRHQFHRRVA